MTPEPISTVPCRKSSQCTAPLQGELRESAYRRTVNVGLNLPAAATTFRLTNDFHSRTIEGTSLRTILSKWTALFAE